MFDQPMKLSRSQPPRSLDEAMRQAMEEKGMPQVDEGDPSDAFEPNSAAALGMAPPASPGDYVISLPRGVERDPDLEAAARQWFHAAGLPQGVAAGIAGEYCRRICEPEGPTKSQGRRDRAMAELRRDWGQDFDRKLALAHGVIDACRGGDALEEALAESGLADNVWLLRTLAALGEMHQSKNGGGL